MQYGEVDGIDKPVSRLVQGTLTCGSPKRREQDFELLDTALALGYTTFDTAHGYGGGANERGIGAWISDRGVRDQVVILGKGAHHNADRRRVTPFDIAADLHDSLARFGVDYIDLYLLHRDDPAVPVGPIVDALNEHKDAGRIHAFGGSNWSSERIQEANEYAMAQGLTPFVASSPHYSLAEQIEEPWDNCVSIAGPGQAHQRQWYDKHQMPVFCWSSLAAGFFSGRVTGGNAGEHKGKLYKRCYFSDENFERLARVEQLAEQKGLTVPQIACAFVMNQPLNSFALVGAESRAELEANAAALDVALTPEELAWLDLQ